MLGEEACVRPYKPNSAAIDDYVLLEAFCERLFLYLFSFIFERPLSI